MTNVQPIQPQAAQQVPAETVTPVPEHVNPEVDAFDENLFEDWDSGSGNWFKWTQVGDRVTGLVTKFDPRAEDRLAKPDNPDPTTCHLRLMQSDGTEVDVGVHAYFKKVLRTTYGEGKLKVGETIITCWLDEIKPPRQIGHDPAMIVKAKTINIGHPNYEAVRATYPQIEQLIEQQAPPQAAPQQAPSGAVPLGAASPTATRPQPF